MPYCDPDTGLEFPRHVHQPSLEGQWVYRIVQTPIEYQAALADGWLSAPLLIDPAPPEPVVRIRETPKPKRGRK